LPFTIPNTTVAGFPDQAEPDSVDIDILTAGHVGTGVITGCAVTAQGSPDMTVAVAVGTVIVADVPAAVSAGNVTITAAHSTLPRKDIVVVSNAGVKSATAGTAATQPLKPAIPANSVVLAEVYVPAADAAINANQITDKRVVLTIPVLTVGLLLEGAPPSNGIRMVWRAPFACTVVAVRSHFDAGTNCVVNARKNQASNFMSSNFTNSTANAWGAGTVNQNQSIATGDDIEMQLVSTSGAVTKVNIQVDLTRP
jgi:hypothetical protein